mmetsp:Transcript_16362/g.32021  ORF Transcript_16362/g.32021 Transcript_16362/m.32021 type:complete len:323 (+) Transcript_16362:22-990(+)|eukprot:CAMPEP_0175139088 /NCGR_PEP_ID=MMETSP0087-20121206/10703_1 /TAXON_ID=136419 /ORGANISM="Unknown Unknown, Strain D1" /LENGTH=322 /DNA_ID=CAMNT_0016422049 /DNA_START=21 /DNA_END=989 /DNA_ORIENTATION=+
MPTEDSNSHAAATSELETLIFWDWDDTLLCSSVLQSGGVRLTHALGEKERAEIEALEATVIQCLSVAMSLGTVVVVTNAEQGWVELSAQRFLPGVVDLLAKVPIVSARTSFEGLYPNSPVQWKLRAFQDQLARVCNTNCNSANHNNGRDFVTDENSFCTANEATANCSSGIAASSTNTVINSSSSSSSSSCGAAGGQNQKILNILSFGDSSAEREAIRACTAGLVNCQTKSVKFTERPTIEQLQRQLQLVLHCFSHLVQHSGDLDLCMAVSDLPPGSLPPPAHAQNQFNAMAKDESSAVANEGTTPSAAPAQAVGYQNTITE